MKLNLRIELGDKQPNRYLRRTELGNWCDRCRVFTDYPEKHNHEERPLD